MALNYSCFDGFYIIELWHCHVHRECVHFHSLTHGYILLVQEKDHVRDGIIIIIIIIILQDLFVSSQCEIHFGISWTSYMG